ncbi:MAG: hypothetical protein ACFCU6_13490, partial [Balneolaceae bacterium]
MAAACPWCPPWSKSERGGREYNYVRSQKKISEHLLFTINEPFRCIKPGKCDMAGPDFSLSTRII